MLAIGAEDNVIPAEVMDIYRKAAIDADEVSDLVIPNAPHVLHIWAATNPVKASEFLEKLSVFIFDAG